MNAAWNYLIQEITDLVNYWFNPLKHCLFVQSEVRFFVFKYTVMNLFYFKWLLFGFTAKNSELGLRNNSFYYGKNYPQNHQFNIAHSESTQVFHVKFSYGESNNAVQ